MVISAYIRKIWVGVSTPTPNSSDRHDEVRISYCGTVCMLYVLGGSKKKCHSYNRYHIYLFRPGRLYFSERRCMHVRESQFQRLVNESLCTALVVNFLYPLHMLFLICLILPDVDVEYNKDKNSDTVPIHTIAKFMIIQKIPS